MQQTQHIQLWHVHKRHFLALCHQMSTGRA